MALYVIDIDNFKEINDTYGRDTGDDILRNITSEVHKLFRKSDIIGRLGGDELVVLLCGMTDRRVIRRKSAEVIKQISFLGSREYGINLSVSIGLVFTERNENIDVLRAKADQALLQAKRGRNGITVVYGESVPQIENDEKDIVLVCGEDEQNYKDVALGYGSAASFAFVRGIDDIKSCFYLYQDRVKSICVDFDCPIKGLEEGYRWMKDQKEWGHVPIIAMCAEGQIPQIREAMKFDVEELVAVPLESDTLQERLSYAIMVSNMRKRKELS